MKKQISIWEPFRTHLVRFVKAVRDVDVDGEPWFDVEPYNMNVGSYDNIKKLNDGTYDVTLTVLGTHDDDSTGIDGKIRYNFHLDTYRKWRDDLINALEEFVITPELWTP